MLHVTHLLHGTVSWAVVQTQSTRYMYGIHTQGGFTTDDSHMHKQNVIDKKEYLNDFVIINHSMMYVIRVPM